MRVSQEEKGRSRARIVESASRLFRRDGVDGASVGDVMKAAGLTHGGFYRHFDTKDALLTAALDDAFAEMIAMVRNGLEKQPVADVRKAFHEFYLSGEHVATPEAGCPAAALSGDIARGPGDVKAAFGTGLRKMIDELSKTVAGDHAEPRKQAIRELAMMVGAVMLARASDPDIAQEVLSACRAEQGKQERGF